MENPNPSAPALTDLPEYERQEPYFNHVPESETDFREAELRESVMAHVAENCCYGSRAARDMTLRHIRDTPILLYTVTFFTEKREVEWVTEPYRGAIIKPQPNLKTPVDIWSVKAKPPAKFAKGHRVIEVPGTVSVAKCAQCSGNGSVQCGRCSGAMMKRCGICVGSGKIAVRDLDSGDGTTTTYTGKHIKACTGWPVYSRAPIICETT